MAYTVLARKYRPQRFDEVVGQKPVVETLKNAVSSGRIAHAYLFTGTRGVGKTTMARILAKSLNCLSFDEPTIEPCCNCQSCLNINEGQDIDVIEIDGATHTGVDQVRQLRQNAVYRPARSRYKIYVIDEVHMLSISAFNALLKILEEPPAHVKFIFATTEPGKIIATIQSRCQRFDFSNISVLQISEHLKNILQKEKIKYEDDLILQLTKVANGSMRDALSLLDRFISTGVEPLNIELLEEFLGCPSSEKTYNLVSKIGDSAPAEVLSGIDDLISSGLDEVRIVGALVDCMRDLLVVKTTSNSSELLIVTASQREHLAQLAEKFDTAALIYNITALEKLSMTIKNSQSPRALLDAWLLRLTLSEHFLNVDRLLENLQNGSVKKKSFEAEKNKPAFNIQTTGSEKQNLPAAIGIESLKDNWESVLQIIAGQLGNSISGLLSGSVPAGFEDDLLKIRFNSRMKKQMCESNGRKLRLENAFSKYFKRPVKLIFEAAGRKQNKTDSDKNIRKSHTDKANELLNEPAVKTVLIGLNAAVTNVDSVGQND